MIHVFLDNQPLVVAQDTSIGLSVSIARIEDPTSANSSGTKTIKIPMIRENIAAFKHCEEILSPEIFNNSEHTARVEQDGIELISGKAFLDGIDRYQDDTGYYKLQIVGDEFDWVQRIKDKAMNELNGTDKISQYARYANLTDAQRANAFFALLDHGCWWQEVGDEIVRRNWATYADLMPFVNLRAIINEIFKGYDITIEGSGVASMLDLLYVTGQFKKSENASVLAEDNDFKVTTELLNSPTNVSDSEYGMVKEKITQSGDPVDLRVFDTVEEDDNGRITITGTAENRNVRASFTPSEECVASFNVKVGYQTTLAWEEKMINAILVNGKYEGNLVSTRPFPIFADKVRFGANPELSDSLLAEFTYADSVEWAERELLTDEGVGYSVQRKNKDEVKKLTSNNGDLFYVEIDNYQIFKTAGFVVYFKDNGIETTNIYVQTTDFVAEKFFMRGIHQDMYRNGYDELYIYLALQDYDGHIYRIKEKGAIVRFNDKYGTAKIWGITRKVGDEPLKFRFENAVLSTPHFIQLEPAYTLQAWVEASEAQLLSEDVPVYDSAGNLLPDYGKDESNGELTIYATNKSEVSPKFNNVVLYGSNVSMNDIGGDASAIDMLKSIMQLFNLRIYTNSDTKSVHLIPFNSFYTSDEVDWTNRIDYDQGIEISSIGDNVGNKLVLSYQESSAPVSEYNERHTAPLNSYSVALANKTSDSEKEVQNAVFNPPIAERASVIFEADKPTGDTADTSAWILKTAGKDAKDTIDNIDYELPRTLVLLREISDLDGNASIITKKIGCYGVFDEYVQPDMKTTADLDFAESLHRHYDKQVDIWNSGKQITCHCRILPQEIEALRKYGMHAKINFRSRFRIHLFGEDLLCRLQSIENYEPSKATCKCTFIYNTEI